MLNDRMLGQLKSIAGDALSERDTEILELAADELADMAIDAVAGRPVSDLRQKALKATLKNLSSAARVRIERQTHALIKDAIADGAAFAGDILKEALA